MKNIFGKGSYWEAERIAELTKSRKVAWRVAGCLGVLLAIAIVSLASLAPFRRTVPYLVHTDSETGNVEVLQTFDNRRIGKQELLDKFWAQKYVQAREQYNWYLVSGDYDFVARLTDTSIAAEYTGQFSGPNAMDKIFGEFTERRIKILSVTPSPTIRNQMVVRFERTTVAKGSLVEPATRFVVNLSYRYSPKTFAAEVDLIRNPMGFQVFAYRRDAEAAGTDAPAKAGGSL